MVHGIPSIEHVDEFCNGCAIGKQHRTPFLRATTFHAERQLELVHVDLCGPSHRPPPAVRGTFC
jgi:hypothetical protein